MNLEGESPLLLIEEANSQTKKYWELFLSPRSGIPGPVLGFYTWTSSTLQLPKLGGLVWTGGTVLPVLPSPAYILFTTALVPT